MQANLFNGDWHEITKVDQVDHVVTDPPYKLGHKGIETLVRELREFCSGNILIFSYPGEEIRGADEYLFWVKPRSTKNFSKRCGRFVEIISVLRGEVPAYTQLHWTQMTGVFEDGLVFPSVHPYQKPLMLMKRLVLIYTKMGDVVFDPFMGSGTTGIAAIETGRDFAGAEIDRGYFEIAQERIEG